MSTDRAASSQTVRDFRQLVYVTFPLKRDSQYPRLTDVFSKLRLRDRHLSLDTVLDIKHVLDMPYVSLSMNHFLIGQPLACCSERPLCPKTDSGCSLAILEKSQPEITYPDGGWKAWLTLLGVYVIISSIAASTNNWCSFIVQFSTFGYGSCVQTSQPYPDRSPGTQMPMGFIKVLEPPLFR